LAVKTTIASEKTATYCWHTGPVSWRYGCYLELAILPSWAACYLNWV